MNSRSRGAKREEYLPVAASRSRRLTLHRLVVYTSGMKRSLKFPCKLENRIQHYPWGSKSLIPDLLGLKNPEGSPYAEMWMGSHPRGPSKILLPGGKKVELSGAISANPENFLGPAVAQRYAGELPFLFKILAAEQPLSIQAHPDKTQAEKGYRREEAEHIPIDDFSRNYRDRNHKPEIICALTPFTAMCGFREPEEIRSFYEELDSQVYRQSLEPGGSLRGEASWIREFFENLMNLSDIEKKELLREVSNWASTEGVDRIEARLVRRFLSFFSDDIGIQAPLFLNVLELHPGEALFQPAGVLHAYVEGMGVELMANSDNVLRGGLTGKHVDVPELLKVLSWEPRPADIIRGKAVGPDAAYIRYDVPVSEFELLKISGTEEIEVLRAGRSALDMCFCAEGGFLIHHGGEIGAEPVAVNRGESIVIPYAGGDCRFQGRGCLFIASVPGHEAGERSQERTG